MNRDSTVESDKDLESLDNNVVNDSIVDDNNELRQESNEDKDRFAKDSDDDSMNDETFIDSIDEDSLVLTTLDNPYNPKTEYHLWKQWDTEKGHYTEEYIARLISMESEYDADDAYTLNILASKVIDDILANDNLNIYKLV